MTKYETTIFFYSDYEKNYQYKSEIDDDEQTISGVYILKEILGESPPKEIQLTLQWT